MDLEELERFGIRTLGYEDADEWGLVRMSTLRIAHYVNTRYGRVLRT
jgi:hypothetical protein